MQEGNESCLIFFPRRQEDVCLWCRNLPVLRVSHLWSSAGSPLPGLPASGDQGFLLHKISVSIFIEQDGGQLKGPLHIDPASVLFSYLYPWPFSGASWQSSCQWAIEQLLQDFHMPLSVWSLSFLSDKFLASSVPLFL